MKVIVAGAGIGGLSAALSLHAAGIEALVIDSAAALRPLGVGINLMPHAVRELTELGLGGELEATGIPTAEMVHFDRHGNRIWGFASGRNIGYHWPQYSIHRGELQMILLGAVRERLGPSAVRTGTAFVSFAETPAGVVVRVRDRSERDALGAARRRAGRRGRAVLAGPRPAASGRAAAALGRRHDVARHDGGRAVPDRPDRRGGGHQRGAEVRRLPHLAAGRTAGPGAAQLGGRGQAAGTGRGGGRGLEPGRLEPAGAARRRAAVVRRLEVRLAGRARADHRGTADPGVPDGGPRSAAVLGVGAVPRGSAG